VNQTYIDVLDRYLQALTALHTAAATYTQDLSRRETPGQTHIPEGN